MNYRVALLWCIFGALLCAITAAETTEQTSPDQPAAANAARYTFSDDEQAALFLTLTESLRCPKCQNASIAGSNAPVAQDLRDKTYALVQQGLNEQQVKDYMVERFGHFIVYRPPLNLSTLWLYLSPWLVLAVGLMVWWRRVRGKGPQTPLEEGSYDE